VEEVDAISEMNSKENRPRNIEARVEDKKIGAKEALMKETLECGCCYGDIIFDDMCQCDEGHLFCKTCIQHYVEEQVFGKNADDIQCISSEGCTASYSSTQLERALPPKLREKVDEHFFRVNVEQANMSDLS
jgi:TRIAD3 protein (E3 ubiquitin-protein ligase RNF216)